MRDRLRTALLDMNSVCMWSSLWSSPQSNPGYGPGFEASRSRSINEQVGGNEQNLERASGWYRTKPRTCHVENP